MTPRERATSPQNVSLSTRHPPIAMGERVADHRQPPVTPDWLAPQLSSGDQSHYVPHACAVKCFFCGVTVTVLFSSLLGLKYALVFIKKRIVSNALFFLLNGIELHQMALWCCGDLCVGAQRGCRAVTTGSRQWMELVNGWMAGWMCWRHVA